MKEMFLNPMQNEDIKNKKWSVYVAQHFTGPLIVAK